MSTATITQSALAAIAEEVARGLATTVETPGGCFIRTPIYYPSGTSVVIRIDGSADRFFVSDNGMGYEEALVLNETNRYGFVVRSLIEGAELGFDTHMVFGADVSSDELVGAVSAIANISQRAVMEVTLRHEARRIDRDRTLLIERLEHAFGRPHVAKDVSIRGASNVEWAVTARVLSGDNVVSLFDYVKKHKNSVSSTATMFHDIGRLERPPKRIVTVSDLRAMGHFVGLLSQSANVIELPKINDETLRKLAA